LRTPRILLKAYLDEFTNDDDVCLLLCIDEMNIDRKIEKIIKESYKNIDSPEILVFDINMLPKDENLYKASNFFVCTYRAQSYCIEVLESMASGIPVITNSIGACRDYCNYENSIIVNSDIVFENKKEINGIKTVSFPFWIESKINDLRVKLRKAYDLDENEYDVLSKNSYKEVLSKYTLLKTTSKIKNLIYDLKKNL